MTLLLFVLSWLQAYAGTLQVDMLDVGQGDGILIRTPAGKTILIDASVQRARVAEQLQALGVTELDMVVVTHPHADHIGGMADVLEAFPVKLFTDNGLPHTTQTYEQLMSLVEDKGIPYEASHEGQVYKLDDGITIQVLMPRDQPISAEHSDLNANSVVMRLDHGEDCFLFTGDSEVDTEKAMLERELKPCDVLKVAHHGSRYASTAAFLYAIKPSIALISVGVGNRYGHPTGEALDRLRSAGAAIYRTDEQGRIHLESSGRNITVTPIGKDEVMPKVMASVDYSEKPAGLGRAIAVVERNQLDPFTGKPPYRGPPTTEAEAAMDETMDDNAVECAYVGSRNSDVFHKPDCSFAQRIGPATRVCFATREEAIAAGRRPGTRCLP